MSRVAYVEGQYLPHRQQFTSKIVATGSPMAFTMTRGT